MSLRIVVLRAPRNATAALVGAGAAALGHWLDSAGLLPFVHESPAIRAAMSPVEVLVWLSFAAAGAALAVATRPVLVGAPAALAVSATPELLGRHDIGAVFEPGAVTGALLQLLLVLVVAAVAVLFGSLPSPLAPSHAPTATGARAKPRPRALLTFRLWASARPRGPPPLSV